MIQDKEKRFVSIDDAISCIGEFQTFQRNCAAMFATAMFPCTYHILIMVFAAQDPEWRCTSNSTLCKENGTFTSRNIARCSLPRKEWEYTQPKEYSIVTTYDIYCDDSWLIQLSTSVLFIGWCIGGLVVGWAADNYGRKNVIFSSIFMVLLCGIVTPFMPNIKLIILLRFLIGFSTAGTNLQMSILLSEIVASKCRPHAIVVVWIFFAIALCVLSLKAYYIRNWKTLFVVCSAPYIFVLLFYRFIPESPRLLRLKGKIKELMLLLHKMARVNKMQFPKHLEIERPSISLRNNQSTPLQLFSSFKMAKITIIISYGAFAHGMAYYGMSMTANDLGGSLYINFFLLSLVDIPAISISAFLCNKLGRKESTIYAVFLAGLSCLLISLLPRRFRTTTIVFGMIGKLSISVSFNTIYVWAIELLPTVIRAQGLGLINATTRIGAGSAPWMISELSKLHPSGPFICISVASFLCAGFSFLLYDTKGMPTLETMEDYEKYEKKKKRNDENRSMLV